MITSLKVYVLSIGENHEGGSVQGVYATKNAAVAAAKATDSAFGGWGEVSETRWESGCDWMRIEEWEVK